ncbi:MAG: dipeptide epimerase [Candidatus Omnitrophica bacterium]|nr:dipeptide epimerase [Candidatus Omnitrophota bacterium]
MRAKVSKIDIFSADIPFKKSFKHASKTRNTSESIFVRLELESGVCGFGESLPRQYVTGETQSSVIDALKQAVPETFLGKTFSSFEDAVEFCGSFESLSGASKCACELALLDAAGKRFNRPVSDMLNGPISGKIRYSAGIGSDSVFETAVSALKLRLYGIKDVKLKVGDSIDIDRLRAARRYLGRKIDIRIDANCAWSAEEAIEKLTVMRDFHFSAIEQPVRKDDIESLKKVSNAIPEPVMADESLCDIKDAKVLAESRACDMFNIRISKCGGLLESLKIAEVANRAGISFQLGCQVGESGVLSAAGRHFASRVSGVKYLEGSYAKHLLEEDIVKEDVSFGYGGLAQPLKGAGLGITVDEEKLNKYVTDRVTIK